ncbi:MAG: A24 family peptidase [Bdellovibrionales bacterium]|jgi:leader peptidase (prepilin peptidase)/N-methyltransferase
MHSANHHVIANILHLLAGGGIGLISASIAMSFGSRAADRLPGESRKPECVYCSRPLTWQEASPLIGWLLRPDTLSFPCPCGLKTKVWQQPACEIAGFILGMIAMYFQDWSLAALPLCIGIGILPAIALIDFHFGVIPDELNIALGLCGFLFVLSRSEDIFLVIISASVLLCLGLFFALVYSKWRGREMLGLGDVKFFAAAGLWLHPHTISAFLALAGALGLIFTLLWRRISDEKMFPFAPALCLSLAICVIYRLIWAP